MLNLKWNLQMKIFAGYVIVISFLIVSIGLMHHKINALQEEILTITQHDREISSLTNQLEAQVMGMETGQRGFIITGNPMYLEPYTQGKLTWEDTYAFLTDKVADNPEQIQRLESIYSHISDWIATSGEPIIELKRSNQEEEIIEAFNNNVGVKQIDSLRSYIRSAS